MKYKSFHFVVFEIGKNSFKENEIMYGESQELKINDEIFIIQPTIIIEEEQEEQEEQVSVPTQSENVVNVKQEYIYTWKGKYNDNKQLLSEIQNTLNRLCRGITPEIFYPYGGVKIEQSVSKQKVDGNARRNEARTEIKDVTSTTFTQMYTNIPDENLLKFLLFQTELSLIPGYGAAYLRAEERWNAMYKPSRKPSSRNTSNGGLSGGYRKKRNKSKTHKK